MGGLEAFDKDVVDGVEVDKILFLFGDNFVDYTLQVSQQSYICCERLA